MQLPPTEGQANRKNIKCRYFNTRRGCRHGDSCPYIHEEAQFDIPNPTPGNVYDGIHVPVLNAEDVFSSSSGSYDLSSWGGPELTPSLIPAQNVGWEEHGAASPIATQNPGSAVVPRPTPRLQLENPREFELNQLRRRFRPRETDDESATHLSLTLVPTDPDFTYNIGGLNCVLHVPKRYPGLEKPSLKVTNKNLRSEQKAAIEKKFAQLANSGESTGLLRLINALDRQLEQTIAGSKPAASTQDQTTVEPHVDYDIHRRNREVAQLRSRLGRDRLFSSTDNTSFTVPVRPVRPDLLPEPLNRLSAVDIFVPTSYPASACQINISGAAEETARFVEMAFGKHVQENPGMSLIAHLNYLSAMMHNMVAPPAGLESLDKLTIEDPLLQEADSGEKSGPESLSNDLPQQQQPLKDRPHVYKIPRPPEWTTPEGDVDEDESDYSDYSQSSSVDEDDEDGAQASTSRPQIQKGRQVLLSFPYLDLHGIEVFELKSVSLTIKCERCKEICDVQNLKIGPDGISMPPEKVLACGKCSTYLTVGFRRELMHQNSNRAGIFHLDGCSAVDLLPSNFHPTCAQCSSTHPSPVVAVRGDARTIVCRGCHNKMDFKIPELKFLIVSNAQAPPSAPAKAPKKPKESLGIVAGRELPRRGRCIHYGKSYRWFRFSCCLKVFACDKCHDAASDHSNEHASRMICGYCSREQIYRPESCAICHATLLGKRVGGFWEGGKGTRDKKLMSRKDPRKYKRREVTAPSSTGRK